MSAWVSRAAITVFLLFALMLGGFIAGVGFHDPDTCWLLALGRWITEHRALPASDPFSYTHALTGRPFVLYQWLSETVFYNVQHAVGLTGLLIFCAISLCCAFIILPLAIHWVRKVPVAVSFGLIILGVLSAGFHFLVRPEIFSYLFTALWLAIIGFSDRNDHLSKTNKLFIVGLMPLTMILWCNMHTGFTVGIGVLLVYILTKIIQRKWEFVKWYGAALILGLGCTLVNPWGPGLWAYLPGLFFAPFNKYIVELRPVTPADPTYYPFFVLAVASIVLAMQRRTIFYSVLPVIGMVLGVTCSRLIPFAVLFMLFSVAELWQPSPTSSSGRFNVEIPNGSVPAFSAVVFIALISGVLLTAQLVPPQVPQNSPNIHVPNAALKFLSSNKPSGRLFNDPEFGDVLLWRMQEPPPVFIDSRFDMYGADLITDYRTIANCQPGWERLLEKYKIDWLFFPPRAPIAKALLSEGSWRTLYADDDAVIIAKRQGT